MNDDHTTPPEAPPPSGILADTIPALVIVWSADEPERVGEVALFPEEDVELTLGRGDEGGPRRVQFSRQRPDVLGPRPPIAAQGISRVQLLLTSVGDRVRVTRKGQPAMLVNGAACDDAVAYPGDTIEIERQMLLLCTERPRNMPALRFQSVENDFGAPDADGILGESLAAWRLRDDLGYAIEATGHVLITGESGTGKELAARAIHARSVRGQKALVAHNAATIPPGLIDSELFGNLRNYPNPGMVERPGLIGQADGGVLFLDEIGELPIELHSRLLRVLDEGEYRRLGEAVARTSDFRLIAATNRAPSVLKHDLLSRLRVRVSVPSMRERREDVPLVVRAYILDMAKETPNVAGRFVRDVGGRLEARISAALMDGLVRWPYATNVREIWTLLEYAMAQSTGELLSLPKEMRAAPAAGEVRASRSVPPGGVRAPEAEASAEVVSEALAKAEWNISEAARALRVSRTALYRLIAKYGLRAPD